MKQLKLLLSLPVLLCSFASNAQFQGKVYEEDSSVIINQGGIQKTLAWCGGFNNPQFATADLNHDGMLDLVVFQADQISVKTFINYGTAGAPNYRYRPEYSQNFPICSNYLILKDYNGDGISDLFETGGIGFTAHKGYYNAANQLCFTKYKSLYYNNDSKLIGNINAEVNPGDIPSIVDVDNDGDLDFLSYYGDGYYMSWYQNMQVEKGLPKDSIVIRHADRCWGKMVQSYIRTHTLGITCDNSSLMRTGEDSKKYFKTTDGGNTPCLIDMDGDGDYDVLDGHRAFNYMVYLENGKSATGIRDSMIYQDTAWTTLGDTVKIAQWAAAFHVDIDADGKRDLMVGPNTTLSSENYYCSQYYKNIGTDTHPSFKFQTDTFMVSDAIDLGSNSYPFFYDYNRDGKPDLFVGSRGYYDKASGQYYAKIMYLQNTSTIGHPSFDIVTNDFLGLSAKKYKGISIGIGDVDNDGIDDFVMGHIDGSIDVIRNTAPNNASVPLWISSPIALLDASSTPIVSNGYAVPLVYDMNEDGVKDLVIGDQSGYLIYYQNASTTAGSSSFIYTNNELGQAKSDPEKVTIGHSVPFIGRMDNSTDAYLVMGSRSGRIFRYTGFQSGNVFTDYTRLDSAYSYIMSQYANYTSLYSAPAIADIDGDGRFEMIVGNIYGGLHLYHQNKTVRIEDVALKSEAKLQLYPNPAQSEINIGFNQTNLVLNSSIYIYNSIGQLVMHKPSSKQGGFEKINITALAPGSYWCVVFIDNVRYSAHFVKQDQ